MYMLTNTCTFLYWYTYTRQRRLHHQHMPVDLPFMRTHTLAYVRTTAKCTPSMGSALLCAVAEDQTMVQSYCNRYTHTHCNSIASTPHKCVRYVCCERHTATKKRTGECVAVQLFHSGHGAPIETCLTYTYMYVHYSICFVYMYISISVWTYSCSYANVCVRIMEVERIYFPAKSEYVLYTHKHTRHALAQTKNSSSSRQSTRSTLAVRIKMYEWVGEPHAHVHTIEVDSIHSSVVWIVL